MATVGFGIGGAILGGLVSGGNPAAIKYGFSIGTLIGNAVELAKQQPQDPGPLRATSSQYGVVIPKVWGTAKLYGGNVIWWSDLKDSEHSQGSGKPRVVAYTVDLAILWCEGEVTEVVRIWANDVVIWDLEAVPPIIPDSITNYPGSATQTKDATLVAALGAANTPAYRNRCYTVINDLDLSPFGNQLPNFRAVIRRSGTQTLAFDNFNRADGNIGVSTSGHTWQWDTFEGQIVSNKAFTDGTPGKANWIETGESDVDISMLSYRDPDPSNGNGFVAFRVVDENNLLLFGDEGIFGPGFYTLQKREAGTYTTLITTATAPGDPDTVRVIANGSSIQCYVNGVLVVDTTSTFQQTATKHGFASNSLAGVDDWSCNTVGSGTSLLSTVIEEVSAAVGIDGAELDLTDAEDDVVRGLVLDQRVEARSFLQTVVPLFFVDLVEVDGTIKAVQRGGASAATLDVSEFGAADLAPGESESEVPVRLPGTRKQDYELPQAVEVQYVDVLTLEPGHQRAFRISKDHVDEVVTIQTALVMSANEARAAALKFLWSAWAEQQGWEGQTLPVRMLLHPADVVTLTQDGVSYRCRVEGQALGLPGAVTLRIVQEGDAVTVQTGVGQDPVIGFSPFTLVAASQLVAWSGNAAFDEDADGIGFYWSGAPSGTASLWPGADLYWSTDGGTTYTLIDSTTTEGTFGTATTVLPPGVETQVWDDVSTVDVTLAAGADGNPPVTRTDAEVLSGLNGVVVGDEYLRFGTVTALGGSSYRLSHLLRGQRGTDAFWADHATGERVVFADGGVRRVEVPADMINATVSLKLVGSGETPADVSPVSLTLTGAELLSYAPVYPEEAVTP